MINHRHISLCNYNDIRHRASCADSEWAQRISVVNPPHACAKRVTVVVSCVCLSAHVILAVRAIRSIMKDAIVLSVRFTAILKWCYLKMVLFES